MARRTLFDQLDQDIATLLAGSDPASRPDASELAALARVAADLRGLPREDFRARLLAELTGRKREGGEMTGSVSHVREGFRTVTPYLVVRDAEGLVAFAKRAFGAEERLRATGSGGGLHAELRIGDSIVMMGGSSEMPFDPSPGSLHLYVPDADAVYARALEAGARSIRPPQDQEYGDRDASVEDPFGNQWYIGTHRGPAGYLPEGLHSVNLYLHPHRAAELMEFVKRAFGAVELSRHASEDGVVHHGQLRLGDSVIEMGEGHGPFGPMPSMVYLYLEDVDAAFARAVAAGATAMSEPADQPYGDRTAHVKDPFGHSWYLATHVRDVPPGG